LRREFYIVLPVYIFVIGKSAPFCFVENSPGKAAPVKLMLTLPFSQPSTDERADKSNVNNFSPRTGLLLFRPGIAPQIILKNSANITYWLIKNTVFLSIGKKSKLFTLIIKVTGDMLKLVSI
jgi:hypothetical protein